jgi:hypothetical protein
LFVPTRHHCFAEIGQIFPPGKAPSPIGCSIQSSLQDGWEIGFSDRKPRAVSLLLRRKKALRVSMPDATPFELLNSLLQMCGQVCQDLGISPLKDDTFEAYAARVERSVTDTRTRVKGRNFAGAIPQIDLRRFSLMKTKPEYVWLGDYPKEAQRRRAGYLAQARPLT